MGDVMPHVVLVEPQIPPNTGNIIRLSANVGAELHLIEPLGFVLDNKQMRRAGLDYHEYAQMQTWPTLDAYRSAFPTKRWVAIETSGTTHHSDFRYESTDALLFGSETRGLPNRVLEHIGSNCIVRVPMLPNRRSLNLSNTVSIVVYEAWRQLGYPGGV